ncbi:MAG: RNA 2'-phosphotransferase [Pseudomonadota bacterium]
MSAQSKFLSLVLRHEPERIGLRLDPAGWVAVDDLLRAMAQAGQEMPLDDLLRLVAESDKKRFTLSADGVRIRAAQGHSVEVDLGLEPKCPPEQLYHGTARHTVDQILSEGLKPGQRQHVHLSLDIATAQRVGQRHGTPVVLHVAARQRYGDGGLFWQADNGVWLTDKVDPKYLSL